MKIEILCFMAPIIIIVAITAVFFIRYRVWEGKRHSLPVIPLKDKS